jgi:hypothetical protein
MDRYGEVHARMAALEREEARLRKEILELGVGEHRGRRWATRVTMHNRSHIC